MRRKTSKYCYLENQTLDILKLIGLFLKSSDVCSLAKCNKKMQFAALTCYAPMINCAFKYLPLFISQVPTIFNTIQRTTYLSSDVTPWSDVVFPSGLTELRFGPYFNEVFRVGILPQRLKKLDLGTYYNEPLSLNVLPQSLTYLHFGFSFNKQICVGELPLHLLHLEFGCCFNQVLNCNVLPESLTSLIFGNQFNQSFACGVLPSKLRTLEFGYQFNKPIQLVPLPATLTILKFGYDFNQKIIMDKLPLDLKSLVFNDEYDMTKFTRKKYHDVCTFPTCTCSLLHVQSFNSTGIHYRWI